MPPIDRVEICGGIAAGKTTLARLLAGSGVPAGFEDFRRNPFWEAFYLDPTGTAFETELTFCLQHYHQIKDLGRKRELFVCDYSLLLDLAYARLTLSARRLPLFECVFDEVWHEIGAPRVVVHLRCDASTELERVRKRGRKVEVQITGQYLEELNITLDSVVQHYASELRIIEIDSAAMNFVDSPTAKTLALEGIHTALHTDS